VFLLFTHMEGSMSPLATKRGYIISHLDLSKLAIESEPSRGAGEPKTRLMSTFAFLDLFRGESVSTTFRHRVFFVFRTDELLKQDFRPPRGASIVGVRELKASALSATYTLAVTSLASGQSSNESASKLARGCEAGELRARLKNNESNSALVSIDKISTTSSLGFIIIKCGDEACAGSNSCEACSWHPKLAKSSKYVNPNTWHLICNNFNLNFIFGIVCLCVCVCAFSLHRESPDMILGDKSLISEVVLSHLHQI
jgi:hypothetical protein